MKEIKDVKHTTLESVTEEEYKADGFSKPQKLINGLRKFYPDLIWEDEVTVIRWE